MYNAVLDEEEWHKLEENTGENYAKQIEYADYQRVDIDQQVPAEQKHLTKKQQYELNQLETV